MTRINQDLSDVPSGMGFDPIEAGDYQAHITESDIGETKNGDLMLKLSWTVLEGPHAGRVLFDNVMLSGSEKAVAFGKRKLRTMADATGHPNPNRVDESEELHGRPCLISVGLSTYNDVERNQINNYKPLAGRRPLPPDAYASAPMQNSAPPQPVAGATVSTPPPPQSAPPQPAVPPALPAQSVAPPAPQPQSPFDPLPPQAPLQ